MRFYNILVQHNTLVAMHYFASVPKLDLLFCFEIQSCSSLPYVQSFVI